MKDFREKHLVVKEVIGSLGGEKEENVKTKEDKPIYDTSVFAGISDILEVTKNSTWLSRI